MIKESNGFWEYGDYGFTSTVCFSEKDVVKFVESIVKECGNIADEFRDEHLLIRDKTPEEERKEMDEYYKRMRNWTLSNDRK